MKLLLHGEGITDCGARDINGVWHEGPIQIFMRKINDDLEIECIDKNQLRDRAKLQRRRQLVGLKGHAPKAAVLAFIAQAEGYDAVAFYRDADRESGEDPRQEHICKKRYENIKNQIMEGFSRSESNLHCIAIIPTKMIESWLLSDPQSYVNAFGGHPQKLPKKPELRWGDDNDPKSNYPKHELARVLAIYGENPNADTFCCIAEHVNIDVLRNKCPISFGDFYLQMTYL